VNEHRSQDKPFDIPKWVVWEAFQRVKANKGAAGVDGQSIEDFERDRDRNLYRIWNRMSSGSYFPPPVRAVEIPKSGGGVRVLGVPTVADRVAQTVAAMYLERKVEPAFHEDSYGYRPNRSALDAVGKCRERCWKFDWVVDLDIQKFFDSVPWELMLKAVSHHIDMDRRWILLYVERWLHAPLRQTDGKITVRDRGTPQGSAISPVLANLFMHYAFDAWMEREFPDLPFERYVDDAVVHCKTERQAQMLVLVIGRRMRRVGLSLHPGKPRSCTAGTGGGGSSPSTPLSPSSATRSGPAPLPTGTGGSSRRSCPRSAKTPSRRSALKCGAGGCTCMERIRWTNSHDGSTRSCGAG